jgi:hypothetical protein
MRRDGVCNPDGTGHALYWGNNTTSPGGVVDARTAVRNPSGDRGAGSCQTGRGCLGYDDRSRGFDGLEPVPARGGSLHQPNQTADRFRLDSPFDLQIRGPASADDAFPVCPPDRTRRRWGSTIDLFGNEVWCMRSGLFRSLAARPRAAPHVLRAGVLRSPNAAGAFICQIVYIGTHMTGVSRSVKFSGVSKRPKNAIGRNAGAGRANRPGHEMAQL